MTEQSLGLLGSSATIPEDGRYLHNQRIGLLEFTDPELLDRRFCYHLMNAEPVRRQIQATATGSKVRHTAPERIEAVRVALPDLPTQRVIAGILDALEDLIENNRRRVDVLEQKAQAIYREWYVRFRFPGHADATFVESMIGVMPAGWTIEALADVVNVDKGLSYKGAYLTETGDCMANLKCFRPGGGFRLDGVKRYSGPYKDKHAVRAGDLIVANTDLTQAGVIIGSPAFVPREGFEDGGLISHHVFAIRPRRKNVRQWLFGTFASDTFRSYARGVASGTTVLGFRPQDLLAFKTVVPSPAALAPYERVAGDLRSMAERLTEANMRVAAMHDSLLPRLVTGKINVSQLDLHDVGSSVA
jgi:type I restriction enzyme S subunit